MPAPVVCNCFAAVTSLTRVGWTVEVRPKTYRRTPSPFDVVCTACHSAYRLHSTAQLARVEDAQLSLADVA